MELTYTRTERIVGLFVIGVVLLLLSTVVVIGRGKDWFLSYVIYTTALESTYGLEQGTPVRLYELDIGKVRKVALVNEHVEVTLAVQAEFAPRITTGTSVVVQSPTIIGSTYVAILPGPGGGAPIPEGGRIPSTPKRSIIDTLAELELEKAETTLFQIIDDISAVTALLRSPDGPLMASLDHVHRAAASVDRTAGRIADGHGSVGQLLASRELIDALLDKVHRLDPILDHMAKAMEKAPGTMDQVQANLAGAMELERHVFEGIQSIQDILSRVAGAVGTIQAILDQIEVSSRELPQIARSTREGIQTVTQRVDEIEDILDALRQNILIRSNLPELPDVRGMDSGVRR
jgi:phospholipid/cholesterol/gamma-HCH transport system substrate-binding protein